MQFTKLGKLLLRRSRVSRGLVQASQPKVDVGLGGIQLLRLEQGGNRLLAVVLLGQNGSEYPYRGDADVISQPIASSEQGQGLLGIIPLHLYVTQIGQGLRVVGIGGQLLFEFGLRLVILTQLPIHVPEAEVHARLLRRNLGRSLVFGNRLTGLLQAIQGLAQQHVRRG